MPLFLALFLVVRGAPALLLYRGVLDARARVGAGVLLRHRTATRGCDHDGGAGRGHMSSSTAAALVGAAILSTLIYPFVGLSLRKGAGRPSPAASEGTAGRV